jgi:hypothetical protein
MFGMEDAVLFATIRLFMDRALKEAERELEGGRDLRELFLSPDGDVESR